MTDNSSSDQPAKTPPDSNHKKKETARISLEAALRQNAKKATGPVPGIPNRPGATGPIPQTIRLKRPPTSQITPSAASPAAEKSTDKIVLGLSPTPLRPAAGETIKRQTAAITPAETARPAAGSGALKKPPDLRQTTGPILGIPTHTTGPIPQTIRLKRPPTAPIGAQPAEPLGAPTVVKALKSEDQSITEAPTAIKEPMAPPMVTARIVLEEPVTPTAETQVKQATTRIPPVTPAQPPVPRTIRLKRPASMTVQGEPGQPGSEDEAAALEKAKAEEAAPTVSRKTETSRIEVPSMEGVLTPTKPRKTLKIKRTTERPAAPTLAAAPEAAAPAEAVPVEEDQGLALPIAAAVATLCIGALVYIMAAQAFGIHLPLPASMQLH